VAPAFPEIYKPFVPKYVKNAQMNAPNIPLITIVAANATKPVKNAPKYAVNCVAANFSFEYGFIPPLTYENI